MTEKDLPTLSDRRRSKAARKATDRAIRRLNALEVLILGGAGAAAIAGGWLSAWLARSALGVPFQLTWFVASFLLFVVPGALVWNRERRSRKSSSSKEPMASPSAPKSPEASEPSQ